MPLVSISITDAVSVKANLVIKRLLSSFFNERYGGSKIVSMDKVYKDVNNLLALSISITRSHVTHAAMPRERKDSFPGKTCTTVTKYFREQFSSSKVQVQDGNFSEKIYFGPVCLRKSKVFPRQIL